MITDDDATSVEFAVVDKYILNSYICAWNCIFIYFEGVKILKRLERKYGVFKQK